MRGFTFLILAVVLSGCSEPQPEDTTVDFSNLPSLEAEIQAARHQIDGPALTYLETALDTIQALHPVGTQYDWEEWRLASLERARGAQQTADTYASLTTAVMELPGAHGHFREPDSTRGLWGDVRTDSEAAFRAAVERIQVDLLGQGVGYIVVPSFPIQDIELSDPFASELQSQIAGLGDQVCGFIVDLRSNAGGNMWPMIAGLADLLGEGEVGAFIGRDGEQSPWRLEAGAAMLDTLSMANVDTGAGQFADAPVGILIGPRTASSGEAVAISFRGRSQSMFFGQPTAGATSSPMRLQLEDGAVIGFASVFFADRSGVIYRGPIPPDEFIDQGSSAPTDDALNSAKEWVLDQEACSAI